MPGVDTVSCVAVIPARGGSKGLSRKNLVALDGKPLIAFTIEHACATPEIDRILVSTDDPEIGMIASRHGAEVVWRPAEISGDSASSESALLHTLDWLEERGDPEPSLVVFLQATSPLRRTGDISAAIQTIIRENADSLFSASRVEGFIWRSKANVLTPLTYDPLRRPRRQELTEEILEENGSIYVFKPWVLRQFGSRLGGKVAVHHMLRRDSFQVDETADLELMEKLLEPSHRVQSVSGAENIRLLVLDFDGVLTDNRVLVDAEGVEFVACDRGDGWGIARLREGGCEVVVISTETDGVVGARCRKLGIECVQGCDDKLGVLKDLGRRRGLTAAEIGYVGNDVNDVECMRWVGFPVAVADARPEAVAVARLITRRRGGRGAVREVADWILSGDGLRQAAPKGEREDEQETPE